MIKHLKTVLLCTMGISLLLVSTIATTEQSDLHIPITNTRITLHDDINRITITELIRSSDLANGIDSNINDSVVQ